MASELAGDALLPAVRGLDIFPLEHEDGAPRFVLRDPEGFAAQLMVLTLPGYFIVAHCDGGNTLAGVQERFRAQFGDTLPSTAVSELIAALDEQYMLRNERYEATRRARRDAWLAAELRDNRESWPSADELRGELERILAETPRHVTPVDDAVGIVAPHLDYDRGAPCYAAAYAAAGDMRRFERFVILGTNHFGRSSSAVATGKDFLTPLGRLAADRDLLGRVEARLGASLRGGEFDHAREHSIELHAHIIQHLRGDDGGEMLGLLCPDPSGPSGTRPVLDDGPDLDEVIAALRAELDADGRRTLLIASADLSHVGRHFGDSAATGDGFLADVAAHDQALLGRWLDADDAGFIGGVQAVGNRTRICSVGCLYVLSRLLPGVPRRRLHYHQALNPSAEMHVTCAAAVIAAG